MHWGLAQSVGTQGPAGVEAASGGIGAIRGCRGALEVAGGLGA